MPLPGQALARDVSIHTYLLEGERIVQVRSQVKLLKRQAAAVNGLIEILLVYFEVYIRTDCTKNARKISIRNEVVRVAKKLTVQG